MGLTLEWGLGMGLTLEWGLGMRLTFLLFCAFFCAGRIASPTLQLTQAQSEICIESCDNISRWQPLDIYYPTAVIHLLNQNVPSRIVSPGDA